MCEHVFFFFSGGVWCICPNSVPCLLPLPHVTVQSATAGVVSIIQHNRHHAGQKAGWSGLKAICIFASHFLIITWQCKQLSPIISPNIISDVWNARLNVNYWLQRRTDLWESTFSLALLPSLFLAPGLCLLFFIPGANDTVLSFSLSFKLQLLLPYKFLITWLVNPHTVVRPCLKLILICVGRSATWQQRVTTLTDYFFVTI